MSRLPHHPRLSSSVLPFVRRIPTVSSPPYGRRERSEHGVRNEGTTETTNGRRRLTPSDEPRPVPFLSHLVHVVATLLLLRPKASGERSETDGTRRMERAERRTGHERTGGTTRVNILSFGQLFSISCGSRFPWFPLYTRSFVSRYDRIPSGTEPAGRG